MKKRRKPSKSKVKKNIWGYRLILSFEEARHLWLITREAFADFEEWYSNAYLPNEYPSCDCMYIEDNHLVPRVAALKKTIDTLHSALSQINGVDHNATIRRNAPARIQRARRIP